MFGLLDYGSDSESEPDDIGDQQPAAQSSSKSFQTGKVNSSVSQKIVLNLEEDWSVSGSPLYPLPSVKSVESTANLEEGDIEDIVKPKNWEKKLAEKARRKLEKKAARKREKDKRKEMKRAQKSIEKTEARDLMADEKSEPAVKRVKIDAFGALDRAALTLKEEKKPVVPASILRSSSSTTHSLFSLLPAPVSGTRGSSSASSILVPPSVRSKTLANSAMTKLPAQTKKSEVSTPAEDSSSDEEGVADFFGLASTSAAGPSTSSAIRDHTVNSIPLLPTTGLSSSIGPTRSDKQIAYVEPYEEEKEVSDETVNAGEIRAERLKTISDEQAKELIYKHDFAPWGSERNAMPTSEIVDVRVDSAIGPNVRATLLKNLNHKAIASASMPTLPKATDVKDRLAKRKHQITYLANVAVAREEALQQQWSEAKNNKRMSRQKYGF